MKWLHFSIIISIAILVLGCNPEADRNCEGPKCDLFSAYVDAAVSAIGGSLDDQIGSPYAASSSSRYAKISNLQINSPFIGVAWADTCARPSSTACIHEVKSTSFAECSIDSSPFFINGNVNLAYAGTANCSFTAVGDTMTRTMDVSRTIPNNGVVNTTSDSKADRRGILVGGGAKLTITDVNSFNLDIIGIHKIVDNPIAVTTHVDFLLRTTTPFSVTGGLNRSSRRIDGGALEIITDPYYVYTLTAHGLTYSDNCCYPTAGSITYVIDGPSPGAGTINFSKCGSATVQRDGGFAVYDVSLVSCE